MKYMKKFLIPSVLIIRADCVDGCCCKNVLGRIIFILPATSVDNRLDGPTIGPETENDPYGLIIITPVEGFVTIFVAVFVAVGSNTGFIELLFDDDELDTAISEEKEKTQN
ncbi:hypothetical protein DERP_006865 [Dermatophagoides pteronyssinus]|uniref:Uncharacterized protein n=1 Tax=Dermatophagoides pteronyssinus TaxID=6956 RepID=A0ABQ8IS82_DERPT|nr:hypothetical protein DERP_006865 [Dermatophagoides pteronyssinus]